MYQDCPKMYMTRYVVSERDKGLNIYGLVGSAAHKAIELHYKEQKPVLETFVTQIQKTVTPDTDGFEDYVSVVRNIQDGLLAFDFSLYNPIETEKYFNIPYPDKENAICNIVGYIDNIEANGFVDYKTGSEIPTKKKLKSDLQFAVYAWYFNQTYGRMPEYGIYHRVRNNKQFKVTEFNLKGLDTIIRQFIADPMTYPLEPCDNCPIWCGVSKLKKNVEAAIDYGIVEAKDVTYQNIT